jgi:hypothetical protein
MSFPHLGGVLKLGFTSSFMPILVLAKINDNAYSIDIPIAEFGGVRNSFSVADLSPYDGDDLVASRLMPFEGGAMMRTSLLHRHLHLLLMILLLLLKISPMMRLGLDQLLEPMLSCYNSR